MLFADDDVAAEPDDEGDRSDFFLGDMSGFGGVGTSFQSMMSPSVPGRAGRGESGRSGGIGGGGRGVVPGFSGDALGDLIKRGGYEGGGDSVGEGRWGSGGSRIIDLIAEASRESRGGGG